MSKESINKISLILGDWVNIGHEQTVIVNFESNVTVDELRRIYFETKNKLKIGLDQDVNMESLGGLPLDINKKNLKKMNINTDEFIFDENDICKEITVDQFINIFVKFFINNNKGITLVVKDVIKTSIFNSQQIIKPYGKIGYIGYEVVRM